MALPIDTEFEFKVIIKANQDEGEDILGEIQDLLYKEYPRGEAEVKEMDATALEGEDLNND